MTIADNIHQREDWRMAAHHINNELQDLRAALDVALQSRLTVATMVVLVECDVDLADAQAKLSLVDLKVSQLS